MKAFIWKKNFEEKNKEEKYWENWKTTLCFKKLKKYFENSIWKIYTKSFKRKKLLRENAYKGNTCIKSFWR